MENTAWTLSEAVTPVDPKSNLLFHLDHMRRLFVRQKTDLAHLKAATFRTAAVLAESPELPDESAVTTLIRVISEWQSSVQGAVGVVDQLGMSVHQLDPIMETDAGDAWGVAAPSNSPSSHHPQPNRRWDIQRDPITETNVGGGWPVFTPDDSLCNHHRRPNRDWDIAMTEDGDPFVDSPAETPLGSSNLAAALPLRLSYHPDITTLAWPRVYMPSSQDLANYQLRSRRVLFRNLPPSMGLAQLLRGIRCYGGIITASIVPDLANFRITASLAAVVEFVYPNSAAEFVRSAGAEGPGLYFKAEDGTVFEAQASLIPTDSFPYRSLDHELLHSGATRAIALQSFPVSSVWLFLSKVGLEHETDVSYWHGDERGVLTVEFASLLLADRVKRSIERLGFNFYGIREVTRMQYVSDSTQETQQEKEDTPSRPICIEYIPKAHLHQAWNRPPYNDNAPKRRRLDHILHGESQDESASHTTSQSTACADGRTSSPSETPGSTNLRTLDPWERYGRLARHRREISIELGVEEWRVPRCEAHCPWGCRDMKTSPLPGVVRDYLDVEQRILLVSGHEQERSDPGFAEL